MQHFLNLIDQRTPSFLRNCLGLRFPGKFLGNHHSNLIPLIFQVERMGGGEVGLTVAQSS